MNNLHYKYEYNATSSYAENEDPRTRFGFNGMLRDDDVKDKLTTTTIDEGRGNSYNFGARLYDPRVARWFTLDPSRQKYPSISPYTFAADNPVMFIDPDGKDYDVAIIHTEKGGTITIKATYYIFEQDKNMATTYIMNSGMEFWNKQSGKYQYIVGEGENQLIYDIHFELAENKVDVPNQATSNLVTQLPHDVLFKQAEKEVGGYNTRNIIAVSDNYSWNELVNAHEIGHSAGAGHSEFSVMATHVSKLVPFTNIEIMETILGKAGIGPQRELSKTIDKENFQQPGIPMEINGLETAPTGFEKGKIIEKEKKTSKILLIMAILLLISSCSQLNVYENDDVCYLHVYVELPNQYSNYAHGKGWNGFIEFLREYTQEERIKMSSYNLRNIDGAERFKTHSFKRIVPYYENLIIINKESFVLNNDTIHFRLRGYECLLDGAPNFGAIMDFMIYKKGDTIYKHYDLSDKECVPYE